MNCRLVLYTSGLKTTTVVLALDRGRGRSNGMSADVLSLSERTP